MTASRVFALQPSSATTLTGLDLNDREKTKIKGNGQKIVLCWRMSMVCTSSGTQQSNTFRFHSYVSTGIRLSYSALFYSQDLSRDVADGSTMQGDGISEVL